MASNGIDPGNPDFAAWAENLTYGRVYTTRGRAKLEAELTAMRACEAAVEKPLARELEKKRQARDGALWRAGRERSALLDELQKANEALASQELLQDGVDYLTAVAGVGALFAAAPVAIGVGVVGGVVSLGNSLLRPGPDVADYVQTGGQALLDGAGVATDATRATGLLATRVAPLLGSALDVAGALEAGDQLGYSARSVAELRELRASVDDLSSSALREKFGLNKDDLTAQIDKTIEAEEAYQKASEEYGSLRENQEALAEASSTCIDRLSKEIADRTSPAPPVRKRPGK